MNTLRLTVVLAVAVVGFGQEAVVQRSSIWVDTVKKGPMARAVRGQGPLVRDNALEINIPAAQAQEIQLGQPADIDTGGSGLVKGKVTRIFPVANGVTKVELQAEKPLPEAPMLDAIVQIETIPDVLYVGRPAGAAQSEGMLFKLDADGKNARKVNVRYGRTSVNTIEIVSGLQPGDRVILSDTSAFAARDTVRLQ